MVNNRVDLFLENNKALEKAKGSWARYGIQIKANALTCTMKNQRVDVDRINLALDVIKNNTSPFSNFRGINKLTTAITISSEINMEDSLNQIIEIYMKLKENFWGSEYLIIAAQIIFNAKNRVDVDEATRNTRVAYDYMKKNHMFLTGYEDIANAAIIATTSSDIDETFKEIEECYKYLKENRLSTANNLQALSHILSLINLPVKEKCEKVVEMNKVLKDNKVPLKYYYLPILGIVSFICDNNQDFADRVVEVSNKLKNEKGFGNFALGAQARNMMAAALVCMDYLDSLDENTKNSLIDTTNNITLTVVIAMQTAIVASSAAASAAAASSASS